MSHPHLNSITFPFPLVLPTRSLYTDIISLVTLTYHFYLSPFFPVSFVILSSFFPLIPFPLQYLPFLLSLSPILLISLSPFHTPHHSTDYTVTRAWIFSRVHFLSYLTFCLSCSFTFQYFFLLTAFDSLFVSFSHIYFLSPILTVFFCFFLV